MQSINIGLYGTIKVVNKQTQASTCENKVFQLFGNTY